MKTIKVFVYDAATGGGTFQRKKDVHGYRKEVTSPAPGADNMTHGS